MVDADDVPYPGERRCGNHKSKKTGDWHRNRQGEPCRKRLALGAVACGRHGGATQKAKARAEQRAATLRVQERARRMVDARAGEDASLPEIMLDLLQSANALYRIYSAMVADLDHSGELAAAAEPGRQRGFKERSWIPPVVEDGTDKVVVAGYWKTDMDPLLIRGRDVVHIHPFVQEQKWWWDRCRQIAKDCAVLRIEEHKVELARSYADRMFALSEAQWRALNLTPPQRAIAKKAMLAEMLKQELVKTERAS